MFLQRFCGPKLGMAWLESFKIYGKMIMGIEAEWPMAARPAWWLLYWLLYFWIWFKYQYHRVSVDGMSAVC